MLETIFTLGKGRLQALMNVCFPCDFVTNISITIFPLPFALWRTINNVRFRRITNEVHENWYQME